MYELDPRLEVMVPLPHCGAPGEIILELVLLLLCRLRSIKVLPLVPTVREDFRWVSRKRPDLVFEVGILKRKLVKFVLTNHVAVACKQGMQSICIISAGIRCIASPYAIDVRRFLLTVPNGQVLLGIQG